MNFIGMTAAMRKTHKLSIPFLHLKIVRLTSLWGWGWGSYLWNDLQGGVYVVGLTPEEVAAGIEKRGLSKALKVFEGASSSSESRGMWWKQTLNITDAPTHFILAKDMDFYFRPFGDKTVVLAFSRAGGLMKLSMGF
jgi:hypothetical protein